MKNKLLTAVCMLALTLGSATPSFASSGAAAVVADIVIARPACFAVTAVGSVFFVVSLPFAAASKSIKDTADVLVVKPAKATFTRPVGDLDALTD